MKSLLREYRAVRGLQARLGNAVALAKKAPAFEGHAEMMECLDDTKKLADQLRIFLDEDLKTYGLTYGKTKKPE